MAIARQRGGRRDATVCAGWAGVAGAVVGILALAVMAVPHVVQNGAAWSAPADAPHGGQPAAPGRSGLLAGELAAGAYGGVSHTLPSTVRILDPGRTDLNVSGFDWIGRPFKSPVYYGARIQRWGAGGQAGAMLDFTHAKAIADPASLATIRGTRNGLPLDRRAPIGETFQHLEFSHGHNMLTLNAVARLAPFFTRLRPYIGIGAGVSLPHTEVGFKGENVRTYEYQFAGFVGQVLAGIEIGTGRGSLFLEYKFTYAPYDVPLSHEPYGWLLVTDLWRQLRAWAAGEKPPGGRLTTTLSTHHAVAGAMVRTRPSVTP